MGRRSLKLKAGVGPDTEPRSNGATSTPDATDRLRPWLLTAVAALVVVRPLFPGEGAVDGDGLPVVMLWLALVVFWLLGVIGRSDFRVRFGRTDAALLAFLALYAIAALWASQHGAPRPALNMLWEWVGMGLSFFLIRQCIVERQEARALAAVMVGLAVALAGLGFYQYFYDLPKTRAEYWRNPDEALQRNDLWYPPGSAERKLFESRLESVEPIATFALTNSLAGYLAPWLVIVVGIGVAGAGRSPHRLRVTAAATAIAIWICACLILTKSRSGYIATAVGCSLVVASVGKARRLRWKALVPAIGILALLVWGAIAVKGLDIEVLSEASKSLGYRVQYWQGAWKIISEHPILGCGPGNFQTTYPRFKLPEASEEVADPHNFFLEVWATAGTPAAIAFAAVLGTYLWAVFLGGGKKEEGLLLRDGQCSASVPASKPVPQDMPVSFVRSIYFLVAGGALGFLGALGFGMSPEMLLLGLPSAAVTVALLWHWVHQGKFPAKLAAIGVIALLVNLLAAGGICFPSVAGTLWILLALGLNLREDDAVVNTPHICGQLARGAKEEQPVLAPGQSIADGRRENDGYRCSRRLGIAMLGAFLLLTIGCYMTAYGPVFRAKRILMAAERVSAEADREENKAAELRAEAAKASGTPQATTLLQEAELADHLATERRNATERLLQEAAAADQLSAAPWSNLAAQVFQRWQKSPNPDLLRRFQQYTDAGLHLDRNFNAGWLAAGDRYLEIFTATRQRDFLARSAECYRQAVELYPNSAVRRGKLALALQVAEDTSGSREQAQRALWLDQTTPHTDKKLPDELRKRLRRIISREN
ncbi:MAG: O-antigen ligase family protein [Thermoguttaceae bacterium]